MRKTIVSFAIILLVASTGMGCAQKKPPEVYQSAEITVGEKVIDSPLDVLIGDGDETNMPDPLLTRLDMKPSPEIPILKIGDTVVIDFKGTPPEQLKISDVLITKTEGLINKEESSIEFPFVSSDGKYEFEIERHETSLAPQEKASNAVHLRGYRIIATSGDTKYMYSFLFRTN